jgi:hypothetical protein
MRIGPSYICALALAAPLAAQAEIYRWVDDRGVINYSSIRPAGVKQVTQIAEDSGRVSTVPGISQELIARQRELELEARIQRLERELYEQRARDAMAAAAPSYPAYPTLPTIPDTPMPPTRCTAIRSWQSGRSSRGACTPSSGTRRCGACAADRILPAPGFARSAPGGRHNRALTSPHVEPTR